MTTYLKNKWVGIAAILLFCILSASRIASFVRPIVMQALPELNQVVEPFLPIDIKNGEIVGEAKVIKKSIPLSMGQSMDIVLDTNVDTFNIGELKGQGIYISKKNIYIAKGTETTVRSLASYGDVTVDEQSMQKIMGYLLKVSEYSFVFALLALLAYVSIAVLVYALLTYLILLAFAKNSFSQVYVVNSVVYSFLGIVCMYTPITCGSIMTLIILLAVNYMCGKIQE